MMDYGKTAAIYIGSYSVQMLIGRLLPDHTVETSNEYTAFSCASKDLMETHVLMQDGVAAARKILTEMHGSGNREGVSEYRIAAASTLRLAENRSAILLPCLKEFGVYPQMLGGRDEARLNFIGAADPSLADLPLIIVYIGYHHVHAAAGFSSRISYLGDLPCGIGSVNREFGTDKNVFSFFSLRSLRSGVNGMLEDFRQAISDWKKQLKLEPVLLLSGPFPALYLSLLSGGGLPLRNPVLHGPHTLQEVSDGLHFLSALSPEARAKLPGLNGAPADSLMAGFQLMQSLLESCGLADFRTASGGICTGMLKMPSFP